MAVQANSLVSARYRLSLFEQRMVLMMISKIDYKDEFFQGYEISIKELSDTLQINKDCAYREAQTITDKLLKRLLRIQQADGSLLKCAWIAEAVHRPGSVTLTPAPSLRPYLLELREQFTKVPLDQVKGLRRQHSVRIYMLLRQHGGLGTFELTVDKFRAILSLKNQYPRFSEMRRWVLDPAQKELKLKADLSFKLETEKTGRAISNLKFIIVRNKQKPAKKSRGKTARAAVGSAVKPGNTKTKKPEPEEFEGSDKELFNEFLEHVKEHDDFIYKRYLAEGYDMMVKYEHRKFFGK